MATPQELRQQDRLARRQGRVTRLEDLVAQRPDARALQQRLFQARNQAARYGYRTGQAQPFTVGQPGITNPLQADLLNRANLFTQQQQYAQALLDAGVLGRPGQQRVQGRLGRIQRRQGRNAAAWQTQAGVPPVAPPPPEAPVTPPTPAPGGTGTLEDMLGPYRAPLAGGTDQAQSFFLSGLSRLNALPQPSFEDQYARYRDVANQEADRQAAQLTEAFGSRGARYGTGLLTAQGDLRRRMATDLAAQSDVINRGLNEQRLQELQGLTGAYQPFYTAQNTANQNALNLLFADAARQTGVPPLLAGGGQYFSSFGAPTNIVQQR